MESNIILEKLKKHCNLSKKSVLDIGCDYGQQLFYFMEDGFEYIHGLDKKITRYRYENLLTFILRDKKELVYENKLYYFKDKPNITYTNFEFEELLRKDVELQKKLTHLRDRVKLESRDFFDYPYKNDKQKKFELIICSFVLHFYDKSEDERLISKLKSLSENNGIIYLRYHNLRKLHSYKKTIDQRNEIKKDIELDYENGIIKYNETVWYLFDEDRTKNWIKNFELIDEDEDQDVHKHTTELILRNKIT